jgi:hypothetical protein
MLQRVVAEYPDITLRTSEGMSLKYEFLTDGQILVELHQVKTHDYRAWKGQFLEDGWPIIRDLEIALYKEFEGTLDAFVSHQIELYNQAVHMIERVAATHPEISLKEGPKTEGYRNINVLSNDEIVTYFTWDKSDWNHLTWDSPPQTGGVPFIRDFEIELNKVNGHVWPDWIKTEIEKKKVRLNNQHSRRLLTEKTRSPA